MLQVTLALGIEVADNPLVTPEIHRHRFQPRQIVAGIRADWESADLVGRTVVICCNLKPARLRGVESQGMMLAVASAEWVAQRIDGCQVFNQAQDLCGQVDLVFLTTPDGVTVPARGSC